MPRDDFPDFDWDEANTAHIARHGVTQAEAEEIVRGASIPLETEDRSGEDRYTELGETTTGRLLLVVWTWRRRRIRVVTSFSANRKWRAFWRRVRRAHDG
ncbi:MAG: BrnT family toxin [Bryobacteraceae bacterium]|jgi:uncharacterized DUF497 family protein